MSRELKPSKFAQVVMGARVSKSGNATPQAGDLMGQAGPVKLPVAQLDIMVNSVQP
jgi:cytochrome c-type biogenesis protein CcmH